MFKPSHQKYAELRDYNHMSDYYVGVNAKINRAVFSQWKNGKTQPRRTTIDKLAAFFKVPANYFYED